MPALFDPALLADVRDQFYYVDWDPFSGPRTFFDAASGSCRPKRVVDAMARETCLPDQQGRDNPGSAHAVEITAKGIDDLKLFFGARSGYVIPGWSSSHCIYRITDAVLRSVPGRNVVTTGLDHASVRSAVSQFAERYGKEERVAPVDPGSASVAPARILELVDRDTCFLAIIHTSNVTGEIFDVAAIVREARRIKATRTPPSASPRSRTGSTPSSRPPAGTSGASSTSPTRPGRRWSTTSAGSARTSSPTTTAARSSPPR